MDSVCGRFEAAWRKGDRPRIEDFLVDCPAENRRALLGELLLLEADCRRESSEQPSAEDYFGRFPDEVELIKDVFSQEGTQYRIDGPGAPLPPPPDGATDSVSASVRFSKLDYVDHGGLGEVYRGQDEDLHRQVAVKFLHRDYWANPEARERLRLEAEVTGRLDHPGVVPVYATGRAQDGRPFYVMRFIEGHNLRSAINRFHKEDWKLRGAGARRMELLRLLGHVISAAHTIAYAHNRGVLHRDIKPDNIMFGKYGETIVVDWGLAQLIQRDERAKASGEKTLMSLANVEENSSSGSKAGTVGYISPEQLPDSTLPVGPACDIYSLGATLYRLLTGTTAFHSSDGALVWDRIRRGEFRRPREAVSDCPSALEAVCLKAMAVDPKARYATAEDFARDLSCWMADEPVSVYREPLSEHLLRFGRRHRAWTFSGAAVAAVVVLMALVTAAILNRKAESERVLRLQAQTAEENTAEARLTNLRSTASFAAKMIGYEVDQRWRVLSQCAADSELAALVKAASGKPVGSFEQLKLQQWLVEKSTDWIPNRCDSWHVTDASGIQTARHPPSPTTGKSARLRSYFHGGEYDLEPNEVKGKEILPASQPVISGAYLSKATGFMTVAFCVPIRDPKAGRESAPLGVLGMSVNFTRLLSSVEKRESQRVLLIDLRTDCVERERKTGLILYHPLREAQKIDEQADTIPPQWRLDPAIIAGLKKLHKSRLAQRHGVQPRANGSNGDHSLSWEFYDPFSPEPGQSCIAAFAPIFINNRPGDLDDVPWMVIVEDLGGG
jgi:eukaryotic-like serine/threonine-protein kinase